VDGDAPDDDHTMVVATQRHSSLEKQAEADDDQSLAHELRLSPSRHCQFTVSRDASCSFSLDELT